MFFLRYTYNINNCLHTYRWPEITYTAEDTQHETNPEAKEYACHHQIW